MGVFTSNVSGETHALRLFVHSNTLVHESVRGPATSEADVSILIGILSLDVSSHSSPASAGVDLNGLEVIKAPGRPMSITAGASNNCSMLRALKLFGGTTSVCCIKVRDCALPLRL
jgi:hypothetical protein